MNDKFLIIINPDGKIYYCKNIYQHLNKDKYLNYIYKIYIKIYLKILLIKFIIFIDILIDFYIFNLLYIDNKYILYIDFIIDLIAYYSISILNKNLYTIYLIKYYCIILLSLYFIIIYNDIDNNYKKIYSYYINNNFSYVYLNVVTFINILILIILQKFYNNIYHYKYIIDLY